MKRLIDTVTYCKQFENIPMYDRYEKGCKNCPHTDLCDILPCMPADIDLLQLGVLCREEYKNVTEGEIQADKDEDYKSAVELLRRFENDSEKLGKIKDVLVNRNYDLPIERLNEIGKIVGE